MDALPWTDPRLDEIPVEECGDPLVDVSEIASLAGDDRPRGRYGSSIRLRTTVVDCLITAQTLLPRGLRLLVVEGHRAVEPPPEQRAVECAPAHITGAAADVTLCDPYGRELNPDAADRRILCSAMTGAGLVNPPTAWWHWSYGDPYWALVTGARAATYGPLPLDSSHSGDARSPGGT